MVNLYKSGGEGQLGIPFAVYPSELYYQRDMFDAAGLQPPPASYGTQYQMPDGSMVDWNYDTIRNDRDADDDRQGRQERQADPAFNPKQIVQYGFEPQRDDLRTMGAAYFAANKFLADDGKTAQIPDAWGAAWKWIYKGMWTDHFIMTGPRYNGQTFNGGGYAFNSRSRRDAGELPVVNVCCVTDAGGNWNLAALPSYNGTVTAPMNADTFRITKGSKHPDEAFQVLQYLVLGAAHTSLLNSISGVPRPQGRAGRLLQASSSSRRTTRASSSIRLMSTGTS